MNIIHFLLLETNVLHSRQGVTRISFVNKIGILPLNLKRVIIQEEIYIPLARTTLTFWCNGYDGPFSLSELTF